VLTKSILNRFDVPARVPARRNVSAIGATSVVVARRIVRAFDFGAINHLGTLSMSLNARTPTDKIGSAHSPPIAETGREQQIIVAIANPKVAIANPKTADAKYFTFRVFISLSFLCRLRLILFNLLFKLIHLNSSYFKKFISIKIWY
jgi:hypothetical protein